VELPQEQGLVPRLKAVRGRTGASGQVGREVDRAPCVERCVGRRVELPLVIPAVSGAKMTASDQVAGRDADVSGRRGGQVPGLVN
jgi:hypothetical protein